jgi:hypothetical protein
MSEDGVARGRESAGVRSHLFAVRLWKEDGAGISEYRGSVRDVVSGAFRGFRDWSDLATFMVERIEEDDADRFRQLQSRRRS